MVRPGHEQRPVLIPDSVYFTIGEDIVPAMPVRRRIDCVLEVLVDGDSATRTVIESVAAFDENGVTPAIVDFFRLVDATGTEELSEIFGNLAEIVTLFSIEYGALFGCKLGMLLDGAVVFHVEAHLLEGRCDVLTS